MFPLILYTQNKNKVKNYNKIKKNNKKIIRGYIILNKISGYYIININ